MYPRRWAIVVATVLLALVVAGCAPVPRTAAPADTSRTSVDWAGTYYGVLPCADCAGIATTVTLESNGTFQSRLRYLGKDGAPLEAHGPFAWNAVGSTVTLAGPVPARYFVGENRIVRVGEDGDRVSGPLAPLYVLAKGPVTLAGTHWQLLAIHGRAVANQTAAPFLVLGDDHRVHGSDGCNNLTGTYSREPAAAQLRFGAVAATRRVCAGARETAQTFGRALRDAGSYGIDGGELTLRSSDGAAIARLVAVPPDDGVGN